jgi:hypothetical protein
LVSKIVKIEGLAFPHLGLVEDRNGALLIGVDLSEFLEVGWQLHEILPAEFTDFDAVGSTPLFHLEILLKGTSSLSGSHV